MLRPRLLALLLLCLALASHPARSQQIAITFDDLPAHSDLPRHQTRLGIASSILATIKADHLPPIYGFLNGSSNEDADTAASLKAWRDAGQPIGNHTWSHPDINDVSADEFIEDIAKNDPLLLKLMPDDDFHWFRYPFLHEGDTQDKRRAVRAWLTDNGYKVAEVTIDFEDYLWNEPYARCVARNDQRSIARLHDTYLASADTFQRTFRRLSHQLYGRDVKYILLLHIGAFDAKMFPELVALFERRGYTFISLPEAEQDKIYSVDPDNGDAGGGTLIEQILAKKDIDYTEPTKPEKMLEHLCRQPLPAHSSTHVSR